MALRSVRLLGALLFVAGITLLLAVPSDLPSPADPSMWLRRAMTGTDRATDALRLSYIAGRREAGLRDQRLSVVLDIWGHAQDDLRREATIELRGMDPPAAGDDQAAATLRNLQASPRHGELVARLLAGEATDR